MNALVRTLYIRQLFRKSNWNGGLKRRFWPLLCQFGHAGLDSTSLYIFFVGPIFSRKCLRQSFIAFYIQTPTPKSKRVSKINPLIICTGFISFCKLSLRTQRKFKDSLRILAILCLSGYYPIKSEWVEYFNIKMNLVEMSNFWVG